MNDAGFHLVRHKLFGCHMIVSTLLFAFFQIGKCTFQRPIRRCSCSGIIAQRSAVSAVMRPALYKRRMDSSMEIMPSAAEVWMTWSI